MTVKDQALKYARFGWPVFPCRPGGKQPLTQHGLLEATTDCTLLTRIFTNWPTANIGVRTGAPSHLVVLDVDGDDGFESLRKLERKHEALPVTASVKTPRGGQHFYFLHPGGEIRNSAGQLGAGLDVRADGGYVVAPPSVGANGNAYEPDERAPLKALPRWLHNMIADTPVQGALTARNRWGAFVGNGLREGERNSGLTRIVGHLLAKDVDVDMALELVMTVNEARCRPPLPPGDVERIWQSICGKERRRRLAQRGSNGGR